MKILKVAILISTFVLAQSASAAFVGVLPATPGGTDWQAYYETDTNLTWAANANLLGSTRTWWAANGWAAALSIGGVEGWRLPATLHPDVTCADGGALSDGAGCTASEMGHLFNVLNISAASPGPFSNVNASTYWSSTGIFSNSAFYFDFNTGLQTHGGRAGYLDMWAVQTGNVGGASVVPLPAAAWLFISALCGLVVAKRKQLKA